MQPSFIPPHDIELSEVKPLEKNDPVTPLKSKLQLDSEAEHKIRNDSMRELKELINQKDL